MLPTKFKNVKERSPTVGYEKGAWIKLPTHEVRRIVNRE